MASFYPSSSSDGGDSDDGCVEAEVFGRDLRPHRVEVDLSYRNLDVEALSVCLAGRWLSSSRTDSSLEEHEWNSSAVDAGRSDRVGLPNSTPGAAAAELTEVDPESYDRESVSPQTVNETVVSMKLAGNSLDSVPPVVARFASLRHLDLSNNRISSLSDKLLRNLKHLARLSLKNNSLSDASIDDASSFPPGLKELNLSGNFLTRIPPGVLELQDMKYLYLGRNKINWIPPSIRRLKNLVILYLGGNELTQVPEEIGELVSLQALVLCDNSLTSIPSTVCKLKLLCSLLLHNNHLQTLPREILGLQMLNELSLRDNPLVLRFVRDMSYDPPSLLELAARVVKVHRIPFSDADLAWNLRDYLASAKGCVNPKCDGVYFDTRVENIKFVDFCGRYRVPLLEFLCSTNCTKDSHYRRPRAASEDSDDEVAVPVDRMKRVLLG